MFNSGYKGFSMSERAVEEYEKGNKPFSKWTKEDIIDTLEDIEIENEKIELLKQYPTKLLKEYFLKYCSWHHTSSKFNKTDFYKLDFEEIEETSIEKLKRYLANYKNEIAELKKQPKIKNFNMYITALVKFKFWSGTRNHPKCENVEEVVYYRSNDKMIKTSKGNKRLSSLTIIRKIEQKTKYADSKKLNKKKRPSPQKV